MNRLIPSAILGISILWPLLADAHPLGNFSISQYSGIRAERDRIEVLYVVDMAEIPTVQEIQEHKIIPRRDDSTLEYLERKVASLAQGLVLEADGRRVQPRPHSQSVSFSPGQGGLPTMRIETIFQFPLEKPIGAPVRVRYRDTNFRDRIGWKEIVVGAGEGVVLTASSVPTKDLSRRLRDYPEHLLNNPPMVLAVQFELAAAGSGEALRQGQMAALSPPAADDPTPITPKRARPTYLGAFTELITPSTFSLPVLLFSLAVAASLGAFHALEPGHGKTVVTAYLVGSHGTAWHALLLGLTVTASHTAGVYVLGAVVLFASRYIVPEQIYPWLGFLSGLAIVGLAVAIFLRRYWDLSVGRVAHHSHAHQHAHVHDHGPADDHGHHDPGGQVSYRELVTLGVTGGIIPCPAALVVLLGALALGRVGFGLTLIVAFSLGLAAVLVALGLVAVYAGQLMSRWSGEGWLTQRLPLASSLVMAALGAVIAVRALSGGGILALRL
jgi:ABC-type nickel/cobalt efflux system permease component RcnA